MATFGPLVRRDHVTNAVISTARRWMPTHLGYVERQIASERGLAVADMKGALPDIASWVKRPGPELDNWPEDKLPCFQCVTAGWAEAPYVDEDDLYVTRWAVGCGIITSVAGVDRSQADDVAGYYGAALLDTLLKHPNLEGFAEGLQVVDQDFTDGPAELERTLAVARVVTVVTVPDAAVSTPFPYPDPQPDPRDPYPDAPTVATVEVETDRDSDLFD